MFLGSLFACFHDLPLCFYSLSKIQTSNLCRSGIVSVLCVLLCYLHVVGGGGSVSCLCPCVSP